MERQISIRLPTRLVKELELRARRKRRTRSDLIREALETFLEYPDGTFALTPYERARQFVGAVQGLPSDLATHPAGHMGDFGRRR
jgi:predicted DNA-binding protein